MKFNYWLEKKKFDEAWEKLRQEYKDAGMSQTAIEEMYKFDWQEFCQKRTYAKWNCSLHHAYASTSSYDADKLRLPDGKTPGYEDAYFADERFGWLQEIEHKELFEALCALPKDYLEIITLLMQGYRQGEIAEIMGISQPAVSKKISVIKKRIRLLL